MAVSTNWRVLLLCELLSIVLVGLEDMRGKPVDCNSRLSISYWPLCSIVVCYFGLLGLPV